MTGIKNKLPDEVSVPVGLRKIKDLGLWNVILELDLSDNVYDFTAYTMQRFCELVKKWIVWTYDNIEAPNGSRILVNIRDAQDIYPSKPERVSTKYNWMF